MSFALIIPNIDKKRRKIPDIINFCVKKIWFEIVFKALGSRFIRGRDFYTIH